MFCGLLGEHEPEFPSAEEAWATLVHPCSWAPANDQVLDLPKAMCEGRLHPTLKVIPAAQENRSNLSQDT